MGFFQKKKKDTTLLIDNDDDTPHVEGVQSGDDSGSDAGSAVVAPAGSDVEEEETGSPLGSPREVREESSSRMSPPLDSDEEKKEGEAPPTKKPSLYSGSFLRRKDKDKDKDKEKDDDEKKEKKEKKEKDKKEKKGKRFAEVLRFGSSTNKALPDDPEDEDSDRDTPEPVGSPKLDAVEDLAVSVKSPSARAEVDPSSWTIKRAVSVVSSFATDTLICDAEDGVTIYKNSVPNHLRFENDADCTALNSTPQFCYIGTNKGDVYEVPTNSSDPALKPLHRGSGVGVSVTSLVPTPDGQNLLVAYSNGIVHVIQPKNVSKGATPHLAPLPTAQAHIANGGNGNVIYESLTYNHIGSELYASCSAHYVVRVASGGQNPVTCVALATKKTEIQRLAFCSHQGAVLLIGGDTTGGLYWRECLADATVKKVPTTLPSVEHLVCQANTLVAAGTKDILVLDATLGTLLQTIQKDNFLAGVSLDPVGEVLTLVELDDGQSHVGQVDVVRGSIPAVAPSPSASPSPVVATASPPPAALRSTSASSQGILPPPRPSASPLTRQPSTGATPLQPSSAQHKSQGSIDFESYFGANKAGGAAAGGGAALKATPGSPIVAPVTPASPSVLASVASPEGEQKTLRLFQPVSPAPSTPGSTPSGTPTAARGGSAVRQAGGAGGGGGGGGGVDANAMFSEAFHLLGGLPALEALAQMQTHPPERQRLKNLAAQLKAVL